MSKFEDTIANYLKEAPQEDLTAAEAPPPAEGALPEGDMPPEDTGVPAEPEIDIDEITVKFTNMVLDGIEFGIRYGVTKTEEVKRLLKDRPFNKDEAIAKLDEIESLMNINSIKPSTPDFKAPGVN